MNWLARLKKTSVCAETDPTKTTKTVFVVSVAPISAYSEKTGGGTAAANDPAPAPKPDRLQAAARALDAVIVASDMAANPDRWCWPQGAAMNTAEIELFTFRLARFTDRGLTLEDAEVLADRLVIRDRERDDRSVCLECTHLAGSRCNNWQAAGVAIRPRDAGLAPEFTQMLQRCDGFKVAGGLQ